jgi:hypothetical protein
MRDWSIVASKALSALFHVSACSVLWLCRYSARNALRKTPIDGYAWNWTAFEFDIFAKFLQIGWETFHEGIVDNPFREDLGCFILH